MSYEQRAMEWLDALRGDATLVEPSPEALGKWAESIAAEAREPMRIMLVRWWCYFGAPLTAPRSPNGLNKLIADTDAILDGAPRPDLRVVIRQDLAHALRLCDCVLPEGARDAWPSEHTEALDRLLAGDG